MGLTPFPPPNQNNNNKKKRFCIICIDAAFFFFSRSHPSSCVHNASVEYCKNNVWGFVDQSLSWKRVQKEEDISFLGRIVGDHITSRRTLENFNVDVNCLILVLRNSLER